jgi:hypothetical protein
VKPPKRFSGFQRDRGKVWLTIVVAILDRLRVPAFVAKLTQWTAAGPT